MHDSDIDSALSGEDLGLALTGEDSMANVHSGNICKSGESHGESGSHSTRMVSNSLP